VIQLPREQPARHRPLREVVGAGAPAAHVGLGERHQGDAGDGLQQPPHLGRHALPVHQVTRLVHRDADGRQRARHREPALGQHGEHVPRVVAAEVSAAAGGGGDDDVRAGPAERSREVRALRLREVGRAEVRGERPAAALPVRHQHAPAREAQQRGGLLVEVSEERARHAADLEHRRANGLAVRLHRRAERRRLRPRQRRGERHPPAARRSRERRASRQARREAERREPHPRRERAHEKTAHHPLPRRPRLLDADARMLDQLAIRHARRARRLARPAAEAEVEMRARRGVARRDRPRLDRPHEGDAPARRVGLGSELDVRRARLVAEAAVHARPEPGLGRGENGRRLSHPAPRARLRPRTPSRPARAW
jgi:hypothetical protein